MKRILKMIIICLFTVFSFYYTNKIIDLSKNKDPIMQEINNIKPKKEVKPVNGIIEKDTMIVGSSGKKIDIETSYEKMKKLKIFDEKLLEYINIKPNIRKENNYEKLITGASTDKKEISIIFQIDKIDDLNQISYIVKKHNIPVTIFIDSKIIEKTDNIDSNISLGIYSYDNNFDIVSTNYIKHYLSKKYNYSNYCLYKDKHFLNVCVYHKINTIKPQLIDKNVYLYLKENKKPGFIYQIKPNKQNIKELNVAFMYLKQKGYKIIKIDDLLKE